MVQRNVNEVDGEATSIANKHNNMSHVEASQLLSQLQGRDNDTTFVDHAVVAAADDEIYDANITATGEEGRIKEERECREKADADADEVETATNRSGRCHFLSRCFRPCLNCINAWPRTFTIIFCVICPLFLLILVAVFFGYFLAQFEGPGEIETNNNIIATNMAVQFYEVLSLKLTAELPFICACTFLTEEEQRIADEMYKECLVEEEYNRTIAAAMDGNPTNVNFTSVCIKPPDLENFAIEATIQQLFANHFPCGGPHNASNNNALPKCSSNDINETISKFSTGMNIFPKDMFDSLTKCGQAAKTIMDSYRMTDIVVDDLISSELTFNWIRCSADFGVEEFVKELFNPFQNFTQFRPSVQSEMVMDAWGASEEAIYCQHLEDELAKNTDGNSKLTGNSLIDARLGALKHAMAEADGFSNCVVNSWAGGWVW